MKKNSCRSQNLQNSFRVCAGNWFSRLQPKSSNADSSTTSSTTAAAVLSATTNREELLRLFILKLEEESNYFDSSPSPEDELCECSKCQVSLTVTVSALAAVDSGWRKPLGPVLHSSNLKLLRHLSATYVVDQCHHNLDILASIFDILAFELTRRNYQTLHLPWPRTFEVDWWAIKIEVISIQWDSNHP